jgi:hypothetical protein
MSEFPNIADFRPLQQRFEGINGRGLIAVDVSAIPTAEAEAYVERLREKYARSRREMPLDPTDDVWIPR